MIASIRAVAAKIALLPRVLCLVVLIPNNLAKAEDAKAFKEPLNSTKTVVERGLSAIGKPAPGESLQ